MMKRLLLPALLALGAWHCGQPTTDACKGRAEGDLVITELMLDPEGTDSGGEWVEVYNPLATPVDLKGLTLAVRDTDGSGAKSHTIRAGSVPARGYFVLADVRSGPNPAWVNYAYGDDLGSLGNARGVVSVRCGQTVLAEVTYTQPAKAARSRMVDGAGEPTSATSAAEANWCDAPSASTYAGGNAGTPGAANPRCGAAVSQGTCLDNGAPRSITAPQPGELVITEVMANPAAATDTTGEWLEVLARAAVDLNQLTLTTTSDSTRLEAAECLRVQPGEYVLLARSGDSFVNGGLPTPKVVYGALALADTTNQRVALKSGDAGIDEIALFPSVSGKAWQLDPLKLDPVSNDDANNFCRAPNRWSPDGGGDYGSPGAANPPCPAVDAGSPTSETCLDPLSAQPRAVRRPAEGDLVLTEWMSNPGAIPDAQGEYFEVLVKSDVDLNGVAVQVGTSKTTLASSTCLAVTANSYLVFGKNTDPALNGNLPLLTSTFSGSLTASSIITVLGVDGGAYDTITATGETSGASVQVRPGAENPVDNDVASNRCTTPAGTVYGPVGADGGVTGNRGTPGLPNVACP